MPGKLPNLTFRQPGFLRARIFASRPERQSLLVCGNAMNMKGQNNDGPMPYLDAPPKLLPDPKKPALGGQQSAKFRNVSVLSIVSPVVAGSSPAVTARFYRERLLRSAGSTVSLEMKRIAVIHAKERGG